MQNLTDFFDAELAPVVRRMADRSWSSDRDPDAAADADTDADNADVRAMVWQGLVGIGALRLRLPREAGGTGASHQDLATVSEHLGKVLYQGPFLDTVTATELLRTADRPDILAAIADGASIALAVRADGAASPAVPGAMAVDGDTVDAHRCFVGFAGEANQLLVVGTTGDGEVRAALVPPDHPTVTLRRQEDVTCGELYDVRLAATPVAMWWGDADSWAQVLATARIRQAGYLVGLAQGAFDLTLEYAKEREQFGQPIGRFQAVAFRLSALAVRIDGARLLTHAAAREADEGDDPRASAAQCLAAAADVARAVATEAMQIHGAIGLTTDHDAQLYYRRVAVDALLFGSPTQLRTEALPLLVTQMAAVRPG